MNVYIMAIAGILVIAALVVSKALKQNWGIASLAFVIGLTILGAFFVQSRQNQTSLRVVGYANKLFESDLVKWNLTLQRSVPSSSLKSGYTDMSKDASAFKDYLTAAGIAANEITVSPITSFPAYDNYGSITSYNINQNIIILSSDLKKMEELSLKADFFADRGILLQNSQLQYLYTKLPDLKKELLALATKDAVDRAKEISSAAKTGLGKMQEARAGVFQITEPYSTDVADYGYYNTSTKQKSISVTVTTVFKLR